MTRFDFCRDYHLKIISREAKIFLRSLAVICFFISTVCVAQSDSTDVQQNTLSSSLVARADKDSIVLRWTPSTPGAWIEMNGSGYVIERAILSSDGKLDRKTYVNLAGKPLVPLKKDEWNARIKKRMSLHSPSDWEAAAEQALYGKSQHQTTLNDMKDLREQSNELDNRFFFALLAANNDAAAAEGLAWRFVDHDIHSGTTYIYRVYSRGGGSSHSDTAYIVVDAKPYEKSPPPSGITVDVGDGRLRLHWYENPLASYSGYYIERSQDGGKSFTRLNSVPHITLQPNGFHGREESEYTDTTAINYRPYLYRLRGVTTFGELSEAAELSAMARDFTPPPPPQSPEAKPVGSNNIHIRWQMKNAPQDFSGFLLQRSLSADEGFSPLSSLGKDAREFTDTSARKETLYYYMVSSTDTAGNSANSLPTSALIVDSLPPDVPTGLVGAIDTNGIVRLHWQAVRASNILGYRVLWANDAKEEFAQRTPIVWSDTSYIDTINIHTLTQKIYYRIAAVNLRHIHSDLSPILQLKRPDVIAPSQSVFTAVTVSDSTVVLHWVHSRSDDLATQLLMRHSDKGSDLSTAPWQVLESLGRNDEAYVDRKVEQRTTYEYQLIAVDSSGLRSLPSASVQGRPYDPGIRPAVNDLTAVFDKTKKMVTLKWSYAPVRKEEYWFVIYRANEGRPLGQLHSVKSGITEFHDSDVIVFPYKYAVKVMTSAGAESKLSNVAIVNN